MKSVGLLVVAIIIVAGAISAQSQIQPNLENGYKPYGSYQGTELDTTNLMNGNLTLHIPMPFHYPQRGGKLDVEYFMLSNAKAWTAILNQAQNVYQWTPTGDANPAFTNNFNIEVHRTHILITGGSGNSEGVSDYFVKTPDHSTHLLTAGNSMRTKDATGWHFQIQDTQNNIPQIGILTDSNGNQFYINGFSGNMGQPVCENNTAGSTCTYQWDESGGTGSITDVNGNVFAQTDTMGRGLPLATGSATDLGNCASGSVSAEWQNYLGPNGTTQAIKVCWSNIAINTQFNNGAREGGGQAQQISTIVLPDETKWNFSYDSYGNISFVGLPMGGSISYSWTTVALTTCGGNSDITNVSRAVSGRTIVDGQGNTAQWTYHWGNAANNILTNWVTDPAGNDTVHTFTALDGACAFFETATLSYQGTKDTGTLLKRVDTTYQYLNQSVGIPLSIQTTLYPSGKVSLMTKSYDPGPGDGLGFGLVTTEKEFDWGSGAHGPQLRETDTSYQWQSDSRYLSAYLLNLTSAVIVKDGNGNRVAETDYSYDESTYLQPYSGALPQGTHRPAPNAAPVRGNQTTVSRWLNTSSTPVTSHTNWYDTGEAYQTKDPMAHTTTYSYDSAYAGAYSTRLVMPSASVSAGLTITNWPADQLH